MFSTVATMVALCFSTIAEFYTFESVLPDFLSSNSISIDIHQDSTQNQLVTTKSLIEFFANQDTNMIVYKNYPVSNGKAVLLFGKTAFQLELVSGRSFLPIDFEQQAPVALVAEEAQDRCTVVDGNLYILHENREYHVIGIYRSLTGGYSARGYETLYYVNMAVNLDAPLNGTFLLDAGGASIRVFEDFSLFLKQTNPELQTRAEVHANSTVNNLVRAITNSMLVNLIFVLTAFLVLLNAFSITYYWIEGRFKEIAVRMIAGGSRSQIRRMMLRDYLAIVTCSYGLGAIISFKVIKSGTFPFIGTSIHLPAILAGYLACLTAGAMLGWISITIRLKKDIVRQMRG